MTKRTYWVDVPMSFWSVLSRHATEREVSHVEQELLRPFEPEEFIFIRCFREKHTGKLIKASDYGKRAFRIRVRNSSSRLSKTN